MTITKVAEMAGVGVSTVSRVINHHPAVAPATARKVKAVMDEVGYVPSSGRRGPKPKQTAHTRAQTGTIGIVLLGRGRDLLEAPYEARLLAGMLESAQGVDLKPLVMAMPDPRDLPLALRRGEVDGVIVTGTGFAENDYDLFHPFPQVWIGGLIPDLQMVDHVSVRNAAVGRLAAKALIDHGCRHPAYLNHDPHHAAFPRRFDVFKEDLAAVGMNPMACTSPGKGLSDAEIWRSEKVRGDMRALVDELLAKQPDTDGIYTPSDQQAAVIHAALRERGIEPGKDIVTVSCNNDEPWLTTMHPRPATIDPRPREQARLAIERLRGRLEHPQDDPVAVMVAPRLIAGEASR